MQDAHVGSWARESPISTELFESVRDLNHRFLDLVSLGLPDWPLSRCVGLSVEVSERLAPLSAAQKAAAANCPYALFDLRFHDDCHWQTRLRSLPCWGVADAVSVDDRTLEFVRLAVFFAWHVASTGRPAAQLLLGMCEVTAAAFRDATIDCLPSLAASEAVNLTARWNNCGAYWSALADAASRPNAAALRRIQLYGLQLAAAARLT